MIERAVCIWVRGIRASVCKLPGGGAATTQATVPTDCCPMRSLLQSFSLFLSTSLYSLFPVISFHFLSWRVNQSDSLGHIWVPDTPLVVHLCGPRWAVLWFSSVTSSWADPAVTTVHPCCVCLSCVPEMCWRMMRTLAMPTAPSLMKVGARPG